MSYQDYTDYQKGEYESQTEREHDEEENLGEDYRHIRHFGKDDAEEPYEEPLEKETDY